MNGSQLPSLKSHNSAPAPITGEVAGTPDLPFRLTGSQERTKRAIEINVERMARETTPHGETVSERLGFLTLTVGDSMGPRTRDGKLPFVQVFDSAEANRRINNIARRFLPTLFRRWVIVTERHKTGAIHFHLAVETRVDIRGGYDWRAVRGNRDEGIQPDYSSAPMALKRLWVVLRRELPNFGFGRAQLEPAKGAESLARYVAKYVEKNLFNRIEEDFGKKLVRYGGWNGTHCRSNDIAWASPRAAAWRLRAEVICSTVQVMRYEDAPLAFGSKWAWKLTGVMNHLDLCPPMGLLEFALWTGQVAAREIENERWREDQESTRRWEELGLVDPAKVPAGEIELSGPRENFLEQKQIELPIAA